MFGTISTKPGFLPQRYTKLIKSNQSWLYCVRFLPYNLAIWSWIWITLGSEIIENQLLYFRMIQTEILIESLRELLML